MRFFTLCLVLIVAVAVAEVFSHEYEQVETSQVAHGHRAKRSPYDPTIPLLLGKTFLLGTLLGPKLLSRGWGPPIKVIRSSGWGWSPPVKVVHVSHDHGWGWH